MRRRLGEGLKVHRVGARTVSGQGRRWRWVGWVGLVGGLAAGIALWTKPWAESVMRVRVVVSVDGAAPVTVFRARRPFRASGGARPVVTGEINLGRWEGELVRVDVRGKVGLRALSEGSTGFMACMAELVDSAGARPLGFVGWQQGGKMGLHVGPAGAQSFLAGPEEDPPFVYAIKGGLWYVLRVPEEARLRVSLKPLVWEDVPRQPEPYAPVMGAIEPAAVGNESGPAEDPPDVFIYLIDALRPDHLGCYGYLRGTSPAIDAFAAQATVYEQAHTPSPWTRPSVATMLTGIYGSVHGAMHKSDMLAEWPVLMSEILQETGYSTRCITANGNIVASLGFDQGYDELIFLDGATAEWVNMMVEKRLAREDSDKPVFMFLHTVEPHGPYTPKPDDFRRFDRGLKGRCDGSIEAMEEAGILRPNLSEEDIGHLIDLYDAEVFEADRGFAEFLEVLHRSGRDENALIILMSDHGESFGEHDTICHGWTLNEEDMHVVFVVSFPQGEFAGVRVAQRVSLVDVLPTVLNAVGVEPELDYRLPGLDLSQAARHPDSDTGRRIYAELSSFDSNDLDLVGVIDEDGYKRVIDVSVLPRETATKESIGLWDKRADPKEAVNLAEKMPVRAAYGEQLVARWLLSQRQWREAASEGPPPRAEISDELRKQLRALGYVD